MMKKAIRLIITVIVLCGIIGIGNAFTSKLPTFEEKEIDNEHVEKNKYDDILEHKSDLSKEQEKENIDASSETEKNKEETSNKDINSTEENKTSVKENTNYTQQTENKKNEQDNISQNAQTPSTDNVKKENPWDSLGITEYEYYNSPAHSWAKLQFKISDYGSREATEKACHEYGDNNKPEGRFGYWCLSVNSYSGDYLGEEIEFY